MRIGVPSETKTLEGRVALVPAACADLIRHGHDVYLQSGAGEKSGFANDRYRKVGVNLVPDAAALYDAAEMIVKVKEPIEGDLKLLKKRHLLFCYLHLAPDPTLTKALLKIGLTGIAFESVQEIDGSLPLLTPMSVVAGKLATQVGTTLLHQPQGGKGKLLGGLAATTRGKVVVLGAGVAGGNAAKLAARGGSRVVVFDKRPDRLAQARTWGDNVTALYAYESSVAEEVATADLVVGAVLVPSAKAPHVVTRKMVKSMEKGSVMVDISIDQGGCFETSKPTTWKDPTYVVDGVTHFCVTNMPGAVPQTSSQAISAAILPYVLRLAQKSWRKDAILASGLNVDAGKLVHPALKGMKL
ncbi:MAG TPA: alanine dehydrogenase [Rhodanobacteraceae bacterium]|nr:alanine dehydrogenase [Rhodanobacteraceae bacterium]